MREEQVAVVTGASSGIGAGLAGALAARGYHVVLVARSAARLEAMASHVRERGGAATVLEVDLAAHGAAEVVATRLEALGLAPTLLVNNAGSGHYGGFAEQSAGGVHGMVAVNVVALTELTHRLLPGLLARKGTVLNIASTVAYQPVPYMALYGATKAFVLSLTEALWAEYRHRGLHVVAVCPGPVDTPFIDAMGAEVRKTAVFRSTVTVAQVVDRCLAALSSRRPSHLVGVRSWALAQSSRFMPRWLTAQVGAVMFAPRAPALEAGLS